MNSKELFCQQLFEPDTSTYTYLLADSESHEAAIIDPVLEMHERDLAAVRDFGFKLLYALDTHIHADHITGSGKIADATGARVAMSSAAKATGVDLPLCDSQNLKLGRFSLQTMATPGHTTESMCYFIEDRVFTGDTLLIGGNGRTDFQGGSASALYHSVIEKLFTLPDSTLVFPGHDYNGLSQSTIAQEKSTNSRLGVGRTLEDFVKIMTELKIAPPKNIEHAVPANLRCGRPQKEFSR